MTPSSDARSPVEPLADEFLARCKRGEKPTIGEYCAKPPDLADEIRDVFEAVLMVEDLKPGPEDVSGSFGNSARVNGKRLESVGDFRILCEIGRGGMGVVYEAEQQALGRRVALKVLPKTTAGDRSAQVRFQREAKAAARMHHANIVPVFDVGQDGEYLYYAMQLIHGQGLDLVIDDLKRLRAESTSAPVAAGDRAADRSIAASLVAGQFEKENLALAAESESRSTVAYETSPRSSAMLPGHPDITTATRDRQAYFRSVTQIGLQTASALSYAHSRGIIHRDIKPGNLILDTTGNVWVTDFGLAKTGDGDVTHTGDILGTVRYMSPERFQGKCDVRSDVYALGMTLYELLTLKAAYSSGDRLKLIELIRDTEPDSPRSIDSRIPRDLETIVMKAIDKDPRRRYQSVDEMAEDLQRFVEDEPIKARRISTVERFARWCRRNPAVATLTISVITLLGLLAVGSTVSTVWLRQERTGMLQARMRADAADLQRRDHLMRSLLTAAPDGVPFHVEELKASGANAFDWLQQKLQEPASEPGQKLRAAVAPTLLGDPQTDFLVESIPIAPAVEAGNVILALASQKDAVLRTLLELSRHETDAGRKARYAATLLQLGDTRAAGDILALVQDPINRVTFIRDLSTWRGDLSQVPELLRGADDMALRSGLCAALGNIDPDSLSHHDRHELARVLAELFVKAPDGGTHSAAGWALRRWKLDLPDLSHSAESPNGRRWFVNRTGMTLLEIPAGACTMGDSSLGLQPRKVLLTRPFYMGDREISVDLFQQFLDDPDYPANGKPAAWPGYSKEHSPTGDCPVQSIRPADAMLFCVWLSQQDGRRPCYRRTSDKKWECDFTADGYRLPTATEWEYANRAGTSTTFPVGNDPELVLAYGNVLQMKTQPGASRIPNGWGLFDMMGNVWEVTLDRLVAGASILELDRDETSVKRLRIHTRAGAYGGGSFYARSALSLQPARELEYRLNESNGFRVVCRNQDQHQPDRRILTDFLREQEAVIAQSNLGPERPDTLLTEWAIAETLVRLDRGDEAVKRIDDCVGRVTGTVSPWSYYGLLFVRMNHCVNTKDVDGCRRTAEMWEQAKDFGPIGMYNAACLRALTATVLRATDKSPIGEAQATAETDRAMVWLQQSVAGGFKEVEHVSQDTDLDALRDREDFRKLMADLTAKSN